jgi:predicted Zn finger-like uncharacterized protein
MGVDVRCPACRAHTRVPDDALGRNIRCKKCNYAFLAKSAQGVGAKPAKDRPKDNRLFLFIAAGLFVLLVVLLIVLHLTGVI